MIDKPFIQPKVIKLRTPIEGDFITRPTYSDTLESSYDPYSTQTGQTTYKYGTIAIHPTVAPALKFLVDGAFWSTYSIHPVNDYEKYPGYENIDKAIIDLINYQIENLNYESFTNTLKSIWYDSLVYGFSIAEMNFKFDGNYNCIDNIKPHSPFNFDLYSDKGNNLSRIYYKLNGTFIEGALLEKFILTTYPYVTHGSHYGTSILQSIYFDVKMIEILEQAYSNGVRSLAIKSIEHHFIGDNLSSQELEDVQNSLFNLESSSLISLPATQNSNGDMIKQHDIKVMEDRASAEGTKLIKDLLSILYKRVNRSLGLPDDLGFSNTNVGSFAKAKEEMNLYTQTIVNNQEFIANFVNKKIIPYMVKYNYPSLCSTKEYKLPKFVFDTVEEDALAVNIDNIVKLIEVGVLTPTNDSEYIRDTLGLPAGNPNENNEIIVEKDKVVETNNKEGVFQRIKSFIEKLV